MNTPIFSPRERATYGFFGALALLFILAGCPSDTSDDDTSDPDAGVVDAGPRDGGVPDAGTPDAGIVPGIELFAGSTGGSGNLDGPRRDARFSGPSGVARAADGTLYVADLSNYVIRAISPAGEVRTIAGRLGESAYADGTGAQARFVLPAAIAIAPDGALIVSEPTANTLRRVTPEGVVTTYAGAPGQAGGADGDRRSARFRSPEGLAFDRDGALYVTDRDAHTLRRIDPDGAVTTFAGADGQPDSVDGPRADARFSGPFGVAVAEDGAIAVADANNNTIRWIADDGIVSTLAGTPGAGQDTTDGTGAEARFGRPRALVFDAVGDLIVADTFNDRLRRVTRDGVVTTFAGTTAGSEDGPLATARLSFPTAIIAAEEDDAEVFYLTESGSSVIRRIAEGQVETYAGAGVQLEHVDGVGAQARFFAPHGMLALDDGAVLVADSYNNAIRRIEEDGTITTLAGRLDEPGLVNGPLASARFDGPRHLVEDGAGGFFVADTNNNVIRQVTAAGVVSTYAGGPVGRGETFADGPRLEARFVAPGGMARDSKGNLYFIDAGNHLVRRIGNDDVVTTVAGTGQPGFIDGALRSARFASPDALVVIDDDTLVVADALNDALRVVDLAKGEVRTFAGGAPSTGEESSPGDEDGVGTAARFRTPRGVLRVGGALYVADSNNSLLRRVNLETREVTTLAGTRGLLGLRAGGLPGVLFEPQQVVMRSDGTILLTHLGGVVAVRGADGARRAR